MNKDFDSWNQIKKKVQDKKDIYCNAREIWWCALGLNVGSEEDGKNELFERPILILKVFNHQMIRVAPLTSKQKDDAHHFAITYDDRNGSVILSQTKTISSKRLSRKLCRLDKAQFESVVKALQRMLI